MNLNGDIKFLKGVGPKMKEELNKAGIFTVLDLLLYFPRDYEGVTYNNDFRKWEDAASTIVEGIYTRKVEEFRTKSNKVIIVLEFKNEYGYFRSKWFNMAYMKNQFQIGSKYILRGKISSKSGIKELVNPKKIRNTSLDSHKLIAKYRLRGKLTDTFLNKIISELLNAVEVTETLSEDIIRKYNLLSLKESIINIHSPQSRGMLERARDRLKFQELFTYSMKILSLKDYIKKSKGIRFRIADELKEIKESLPFELTDAQKRTLREILVDQKSDYPMNRLVQGDVGSGKTIVAIISMLNVVKNGYQASMMAPTAILAAQHFEETCKILEGFNVKIELLVGSTTKKNKERIKKELSNGEIDIIIGTHALIEDNVIFNNLGMVITDEQHRFGVNQRCRFSKKDNNVEVLVMTATPIPRTLSLYLYGDLDVSAIDQLPKGRKPIETRYIEKKNSETAYEFIFSEVQKGRQAYIVCPLVKENEEMKLSSVEEHYSKLKKGIFRNIPLEFIHGKMKPKEKDEIMERFKSNQIKVLISTTVIEVGVNVPNATVMVIENAERFGLAQLHQLRGRVGRGEYQSYCVLIPEIKSETTRKRMEIMVKSNDGFYIAEQDMQLRGTGELFGVTQSGENGLILADVKNDSKILIAANSEAKFILQSSRDEHKKMRNEILKKISSATNYICYN